MADIRNILPDWDTLSKKITQPIRVIGIDLGTTNSTATQFYLEPGHEPRLSCLEIEQDTREGIYTNPLLPSVVALLKDKEYIGEGAKRLRARAPEFGLTEEKSIFWECKNHMGIRKTYNKAPEGYQSAREISGRLLDYMMSAARKEDDTLISKTVVTVPASFQTPQRNDTIMAARDAGVELPGGDLLDEPVAAFLAWLYLHGGRAFGRGKKRINALVFDFGGGTCDVAVFTLTGMEDGGLKAAPRSVSRYHRLGGGDIDRAVLFEVLLKKIIEQNGLAKHSLTYTDKVRSIQPAFLGVAEALKTGLCREMSLKRKFGAVPQQEEDAIVKTLPGLHSCILPDGRKLALNSPSLSGKELREVLAPFVDPNIVMHRETEYQTINSIFTPLMDALERAHMGREEIDCCLMVGGSTLIPQVMDAVGAWFKNAALLKFDTEEDTQLAVAKGAACQALHRELTGKSLVMPVTSGAIAVKTTGAPVELIPGGEPLPFPSPAPGTRQEAAQGEWREIDSLAVPRSSVRETVPLLIDLVNGDGSSMGRLVWALKAPVEKGQALRLQYRMDENQQIHFRLTLKDGGKRKPFVGRIENPLHNVVNTNTKRERLMTLEEEIRTGELAREEIERSLFTIAKLYYELNQNEKALEYLRRVLKAKGQPDPDVLNYMGIVAGALGNSELQESCYINAAEAGSATAPLFNLALMYETRRDLDKAAEAIEQACRSGSKPMYYALWARIEKSRGNMVLSSAYAAKCLESAAFIPGLDDWDMAQVLTAARLAGDKEKIKAIEEEKERRMKTGREVPAEGFLPDLRTRD